VNGRPLRHRLTLGPVELDRYLAGQLQGLAYMRRLRAIEDEEARHLRELEHAWRALADEVPDGTAFEHAWRELAVAWDFRRINDLIAKHNAYYPVEARVPMSPRTGGYTKSWQRGDYSAEWILERFPASRDQVPGDLVPSPRAEAPPPAS